MTRMWTRGPLLPSSSKIWSSCLAIRRMRRCPWIPVSHRDFRGMEGGTAVRIQLLPSHSSLRVAYEANAANCDGIASEGQSSRSLAGALSALFVGPCLWIHIPRSELPCYYGGIMVETLATFVKQNDDPPPPFPPPSPLQQQLQLE